MRILQVIPETRLGGAESFGFVLSAALAGRGHDVLLLSTYANGPLFDRKCPDRLQVRALDRKGRLDPRSLPFLLGAVRRFQPEILHGHNFVANVWVRLAGWTRPGIPVVCHEHSGKKIRWKGNRPRIDRVLHRRSGAVIAVSRELEDWLRSRYGLGPPVLRYIPNGIEEERYQPPPKNRRITHEAVCVANLSPVKNHKGLLHAWGQVVRKIPEARLTLVGDGELHEQLQRQAEEQGISGSVVFAGTQSDVRPFLWRASLFVLASHREGMPLSLLEAMAAGLPSVCTAVGEIPEIVRDGETGRVVAPDDSGALAEGIVDLFARGGEIEAMGESARRVVSDRYGLARCVDAVEQVYHDLCGGKAS